MPRSTTKRTSPAEQTKTKSAPAARQAQQMLNPTQERIIDAVSDMLTHGGREDDIEALILATMTHIEHREVDVLFKDRPEDRQKLIARRINAGFEEWKTDLAIGWRANKRKELPETEPKTVSDRIRARSRELLKDEFENFLREGSPEEVLMLHEILNTWESGITDRVEGVDEIRLGEAFGWVLDQNDTYIRLPKDYREKVQRYIDALQAIEDKAA